MPLFLRAGSYAPQEDQTIQPTTQAITAEAEKATEAPAQTPSPTPSPAPTPTPTLTPIDEITPDEDIAGIMFSNGDEDAGALLGASNVALTTPSVQSMLVATDSPANAILTIPTATQPGNPEAILTIPDGTQAPTATPSPTSEPGIWRYADDSIQVEITRKEQGSFVYFAADIQLTDPSQFTYAFSNEKYDARTEALSDIAERHDPLVAINGDYYSFHPNGIIIRGGELFRKSKSTRHLLVVEANGDLNVITDRSGKQSALAEELLGRGVLHTFEFGPELVRDGAAVTLNSTILRVGKGYLEPRTAIGQLGPLHYLVIVVDGRSEGYSEGCDLPTLQQLFLDHGVQTAFNLDGGGSTTLWFDGEVINQPASGDERKVSDIVMFVKK